jgi:predicted GNAT family N-acyltransferase
LKIKQVETPKEREDAFYVRKLVFVEEQGVPMSSEIDEYEDAADHLVIYNENNDEPVAAGRLRVVDGVAKLERICVIPAFRKYGLGKSVVQALESMAERKGILKAKLHGQTHAQPFYEKLGYSAVSDVFIEEGIPHIAMVKALKKS